QRIVLTRQDGQDVHAAPETQIAQAPHQLFALAARRRNPVHQHHLRLHVDGQLERHLCRGSFKQRQPCRLQLGAQDRTRRGVAYHHQGRHHGGTRLAGARLVRPGGIG
ncbi:hypothetical protein RZS08_44120, partial [Arthrospira platensis SPKY1]|nr:hypothetical protein [Arthrospira platensis SPKY1]